ncbi:uncharacterized protein LOC126679989 [Mercurialis annua]|uniref:uncharacterized protein LOC126679989 n=1 Tax=Mercurialis annua TaxID=3986 RepID=UPI00215EFD84|nr:uncharacterized protein LOC126679989 [Mercurialis annua]
MGEQPDEEKRVTMAATDDGSGGGKRKLDALELAKQRAQEIASRIAAANDASSDLKRPRLFSATSTSPPPPRQSNFSYNSNSAPSYSYPAPVSYASQPSHYHGSQGPSKRISIPNGKVGVVIGKGGETIKQIQLQSGAKIQITKDQDADPHALTRDVELMGTSEQISRAEELVNEVIAETDTGGSAPSAGHGQNTKQPGAEQFSMVVPNDKVGLLIGKGGETIKYMQSRSGARMQIIPLHLPPGDPTAERTVYINGSTEQIEAAKELINEVISGKRILNPSGSGSYGQPVYPSTGNWAQAGQAPMQQQPQYGYAQPGNQPTPASYYGQYPQQPAWDQSNPTMSQTPQQMAGYGYYGQQQPQIGSTPPNPNYGYGQTPPATDGAYEQSYNQQTPNYGQNMGTTTQEQQRLYATSTYGSTAASQSDGTVSSQSTQAPPAYPPSAYSQPTADPHAYWNSSNYASQAPHQTGYDQTGYGAYPQPPTTAPANYGQGYGQPQAQPTNNGHPESLSDGNASTGNASNTPAKEAVSSQT